MDPGLFAVQLLNGLQLGVLLFLIAAGLTLVFGIMDVINLAHGVLYMAGAYAAALTLTASGSLLLAVIVAPVAAFGIGIVLDRLVLRRLYARDHLDQVLATFGVILLMDGAVRAVLGPAPLPFALPAAFAWSIPLGGGLTYPIWRVVVILAGMALALALFLVIRRTRLGMLVRAAAVNAPMLQALGVDTGRLYMAVVGMGAMLAGFAGLMAAPLVSVQPGMGDGVLILAFVVIVTGGLGSIEGALVGALLVGLVDTLGKSFLTDLLRLVVPPADARAIGPAIASMLVYLLMAAVLIWRPQGLIPARTASDR